nr:hypothetical protein [Ancylobacter koreensis]
MYRAGTVVATCGLVMLGFAGAARADVCQTAGTLTEVAGTVVVDKGNGFVPGTVGTSLKSGDKVAVQGSGSAVVDFGSDRTVTVPGSTTETLKIPGCGLTLTEDPTGLIVTTTVIAGGITAAVLVSDSDDKKVPFIPISP